MSARRRALACTCRTLAALHALTRRPLRGYSADDCATKYKALAKDAAIARAKVRPAATPLTPLRALTLPLPDHRPPLLNLQAKKEGLQLIGSRKSNQTGFRGVTFRSDCGILPSE